MSEQVSDSAGIIDNTGVSRFELHADGWLAELVYRIRGDRLVLVHTEVPVELEGRGIGGRLVTAAVDRAAREGLTLVPLCPFARGWLERHPEAASRAVIDWDSQGHALVPATRTPSRRTSTGGRSVFRQHAAQAGTGHWHYPMADTIAALPARQWHGCNADVARPRQRGRAP